MSDSEGESLDGWPDAGPDLPQLDDLRMFVAVAQAGSLRSAAARLFISQPTLSRSVARLEARLGVVLLRRGARGVRLTRHGEALLAQARRVLAAVSDLRHHVTELATGTLRLGATATSARRLLAPFLAEWMPAHPGVHVTAIEDAERRLHAHLESGRCDVAIVSGPMAPQVESVHVVTARVIALYPPGHPMSGNGDPVRVADLAGEPLLVNGAAFPSTALLLRAMDAADLRPDIVYECTAGQTLAAMAEAGLGTAVFADTADLRGFAMPRHQVVDAAGVPLKFDLYVAWLRDTVPSWVHDFAVELSAFHRAAGRA